jgi:hypothetical protein
MYYTTPSGETYQQAYYRSQTTQRANYLGTCADNGSVAGYDSFAGMLGEPLDRLQIHINDCIASINIGSNFLASIFLDGGFFLFCQKNKKITQPLIKD